MAGVLKDRRYIDLGKGNNFERKGTNAPGNF